MWKIGNVEIKNKIVVGPMAGISNEAFYSLCLKFNAGLVFNEMVNDKAILYSSEKTLEMTKSNDDIHPLAMQLFGNEVETMVKAAQYLDEHTNCDIIDINMGCPANKIVKNKGGSYLMKDEELACAIVENVVKAVKKPVTVKMRLGFDHDHINCIELAKKFEQLGVKAITLHGRTRSDLYEGHANWDYIRQMKEALNIPVIGNGDVRTLDDAKRMFDETGCDAVMVCRGAIGNPYLIQELVSYYDHEEYIKPTFTQRLDMCLKHAQDLIDLKGEKIAMKQFRGIGPWYFTGMPFSARIKGRMVQIKTFEDLKALCDEYKAFIVEYEKERIEKNDD